MVVRIWKLDTSTKCKRRLGKLFHIENSFYTILYNKPTNAPIIQIDDFVEEESASRGTRKACAHELWPVGEIGVAWSAGEQATATDVLEEYHTHLERQLRRSTCLRSIRDRAVFIYSLANRYESICRKKRKSHNCQCFHTAHSIPCVRVRLPNVYQQSKLEWEKCFYGTPWIIGMCRDETFGAK